MTLLVEDAMRLWRDIPGEKLHEAVEQSIVEAGAFPATTGLVARVWAERKRKPPELDYAALGRRDQELARIQAKNALPEPTLAECSDEFRNEWMAKMRAAAGMK